MKMRTFTRSTALAAVTGAMALLAACGSGSGSNSGSNSGLVIDNPDEVGSACAVVGEDVTIDLCVEEYVQPSTKATANGVMIELFNSPAGGDSVNCFQGICQTEVQAGDEFTAICEQDGYIGVILPEQFRYQDDYYVAEVLSWAPGSTDDSNRFVGIVFIPESGLENADDVIDNLEAEFGNQFGEDYKVHGSCWDPRAAVDTDEMEEYFASVDAA